MTFCTTYAYESYIWKVRGAWPLWSMKFEAHARAKRDSKIRPDKIYPRRQFGHDSNFWVWVWIICVRVNPFYPNYLHIGYGFDHLTRFIWILLEWYIWCCEPSYPLFSRCFAAPYLSLTIPLHFSRYHSFHLTISPSLLCCTFFFSLTRHSSCLFLKDKWLAN